MCRSVLFPVLAISETVCLRVLKRTGLLERAVVTSDLDDAVEETEAQCSVESSSVTTATSRLV